MIKKITAIMISVVFLFIFAVALGSCFPKTENTDTVKDTDARDGEIILTDEEGVEVSPGGTDIPEGWPGAVPVSGDVEISFSGSFLAEGKTSWNISGIFSGSGQEVYDWYREKLSGWDIDSDSVFESDGQKTFALQVSDDSYIVEVWVTQDEDGTVIIQNVREK